MKVFFDHNMSPALARASRELFRDRHEIAILSEKFRRDATDMEWITALGREGRWLVISEDRRITKNRAELAAFRGSRLVGIFLAKAVHKAPVVKKMERLLAVWPAIGSIGGHGRRRCDVRTAHLRHPPASDEDLIRVDDRRVRMRPSASDAPIRAA